LASRPRARLLTAASGSDGLTAVSEHRPDLILLDVHLADMTGDQVLNRLKAQPATDSIPVIVLSADASPWVIRRLRTAGACAYLTKPLDLAKLGELIDSFDASASLSQVREP